jgi:hypothetical protein
MLRSGCWRRALVHLPRQRSPRRLCRWMEKRGRRSRTRQRPNDRLIVYSLAATFRARASLEQRSRMDALQALDLVTTYFVKNVTTVPDMFCPAPPRLGLPTSWWHQLGKGCR